MSQTIPRPGGPTSGAVTRHGARRAGRTARRVAWPLWVALPGFPIVWLLGASPLIWVIVAVPMAAQLIMRSRVRVPPGFPILLLFLAWVLLSGTQVDSLGRGIGFTYRWAQFAAAAVTFLYVYNLDGRVQTKRVLGWLAAFWVIVVIGGYLALIAPDLAKPNPFLTLLPRSIARDEFVQTLFQPDFAQIHVFLGYPLPRPAAPFPYTNTWGATFALLLPAVAGAVIAMPQKRLLRLALLASVIPAVVSVNRGMWLSIGAWLMFAMSQRSSPRIRRAVSIISAALMIVLLVVSLSSLGDVVRDRLATPHSNSARADVVEGTVAGIIASPFLGYGAPRPYDGPGLRPSLGTQGQLWYIGFAHGLPAVALLLIFFAVVYRRLTPELAPESGLWARSSLVILAVLLPVYDVEGVALTVVFVMLAVALREARLAADDGRRTLPAP